MGLEIPPLRIKIMLESNLLRSIMLVRKLAVPPPLESPSAEVPVQAAGPQPDRRRRSAGRKSDPVACAARTTRRGRSGYHSLASPSETACEICSPPLRARWGWVGGQPRATASLSRQTSLAMADVLARCSGVPDPGPFPYPPVASRQAEAGRGEGEGTPHGRTPYRLSSRTLSSTCYVAPRHPTPHTMTFPSFLQHLFSNTISIHLLSHVHVTS